MAKTTVDPYYGSALTPPEAQQDNQPLILKGGEWAYVWLEGVLCILLGVTALVIPALGILPVDMMMGAIFLAQACAQILRSFQTQGMPGFLAGLMSAVTTLILGLIIFVYPDEWVSIRLMVLLYLVTLGLTANRMGHLLQLAPYAGGLRFLGGVSIACAVMVLIGWGKDQGWQLALLVGGVLIIMGFLNLAISMRLASLHEKTRPSLALLPEEMPAPAVTPASRPAVHDQAHWWRKGKQRTRLEPLMHSYETVYQSYQTTRWPTAVNTPRKR